MPRATDSGQILSREDPEGTPSTDPGCKNVMLQAERHDRITITEVAKRIKFGWDIPSEAEVVKRTSTYFGPKIIIYYDNTNYLLTAPGPDAQLLIWCPNLNNRDERVGWEKLAEVKADFVDDQPQYDLCPECGNPLQTLEHERKAAVGRCPGPT